MLCGFKYLPCNSQQKIWQTVTPLFFAKLLHKEINLVENEMVLQNEKFVTNTFNNYLCDVVTNLSISVDW